MIAVAGRPFITGAIVETGLLGWLTVNTLLVDPLELLAVTVQVIVLAAPELFSEAVIVELVVP